MIAGAGAGSKVRSGLLAGLGILALAVGLAVLAVVGKPSAVRRPDPVDRPVLLVPDFVNRTGDGELSRLAGILTEAVREGLDGPESIFVVSPRQLRPAFGPEEREEGLVRIAARLGADYVLVGSLETGPASPLGPGSVWGLPASAAEGSDASAGFRLDVLLVRDAEPPEVFAERFLLEDGAGDPTRAERTARIIADRIAISLRHP